MLMSKLAVKYCYKPELKSDGAVRALDEITRLCRFITASHSRAPIISLLHCCTFSWRAHKRNSRPSVVWKGERESATLWARRWTMVHYFPNWKCALRREEHLFRNSFTAVKRALTFARNSTRKRVTHVTEWRLRRWRTRRRLLCVHLARPNRLNPLHWLHTFITSLRIANLFQANSRLV
jgi:hypothetical protein